MKNRNWNLIDDDLLFDMMRKYANLDSIFNDINEEQTRAFDVTVARSQWLEKHRRAMEAQGRNISSYNLITQAINAIAAIELGTRKKIIAKPTGKGSDTELAEVVSQVVLHFFDKTKFDKHRSKSFINKIIAKYSVYHIRWNYENNNQGELEITTRDPREIRFEPNYADTTWQYANYIFDKPKMTVEDIIYKYATNDPEMRNAIMNEANLFFEQDKDRGKWLTRKLKSMLSAVYEVATNQQSQLESKFLNWFDPFSGKFDVLELHEKRTELRLIYNDRKRQKRIDVTDVYQWEYKAKAGLTHDGMNYDNEILTGIKERYSIDADEPREELETKRFVTAVIPAFRLKVNEQPYPYKSKTFCYIPDYCYDYHADIFKSHSVIDDLIDPQSQFNKAMSLNIELMWKYANAGWIMDANAIDGYEEDWQSGRLATYKRTRPGYMNQIKAEQLQQVSPDLIRTISEMPLLMEHLSQAGAALKGRSDPQEKSAKHFIARENQQEKSFGHLLDNSDNSQIAVAEYSWALIQYNVTTQRIFRITEDISGEPDFDMAVNQKVFAYDPEKGAIVMKIKNDITAGEFDFVFDKTPYTSNAKEIEFQKMAELFDAVVQINPKKADAMLPILVEAGSFPYAKKILEAWQQAEGGSPEQQKLEQLMQQVQQIMIKLGIAEKKAEVEGIVLDNQKKMLEIKQMAKDNVLGQFKNNGNNGKKDKKQFQLN